MVPLNPLTIAMVGMFLGLWVEGKAFLSGYPEEEGSAPATPTLAIGGFILAGVALLLHSLWVLFSTRLAGTTPVEALGLSQSPLLLSGTTGMYGAILLTAGIAQLRGWDLRPVGQMCLAGIIMQIFIVIAFAQATAGLGAAYVLATIILAIFVLLIASLYLLITGRLTNVKVVGLLCQISAIGALWLGIGFTGVVPFLSLA